METKSNYQEAIIYNSGIKAIKIRLNPYGHERIVQSDAKAFLRFKASFDVHSLKIEHDDENLVIDFPPGSEAEFVESLESGLNRF